MQRASTLLRLGRVDEAEKDFIELVSIIRVLNTGMKIIFLAYNPIYSAIIIHWPEVKQCLVLGTFLCSDICPGSTDFDQIFGTFDREMSDVRLLFSSLEQNVLHSSA